MGSSCMCGEEEWMCVCVCRGGGGGGTQTARWDNRERADAVDQNSDYLQLNI